ncbi:MAG: mannose-6-phosphate isomerase [Streptosporangiales bacterium]|nr:mannose-6-phosphate isomerase [Streptosporangiales bacterium]
MDLDPSRLDDLAALEALDRSDMLRQVASSAAQVREGVLEAQDAGLAALAEGGRPRSVVVTGMGGSGIAGDVLAAVCGPGCPVPVLTVRSYNLPGWAGVADLVIAVSCSGSTEETLACATEAVRRGCRLLAVGARGSPLAELAERARAPFVRVRSAGQPRSTLWALSVPLVAAAHRLGLVSAPDEAFEAAAARLEDISLQCRPSSESFVNPAKELALGLAGALPLVWGSSDLAGTAAYRFSCQLAENAKYPSVFGALPEANHNQVVAFDGPFAQAGGEEDFFRDRVEEPLGRTALRLVVLRDTEEHPQVAKRREVSGELAASRGAAVSEVAATGTHPLERLASLVGVLDYVSVYLALLYGIDPSPVAAIEELKARIAE